MSGKQGESTGVVEIDALGEDEWEHEQHTPRAIDENLAALVKQSSAQSGPARAPSPEDVESIEPAKSRTTTNTVVRPTAPKTKTMALPTIAVVPPKVTPKPAAPATAKAVPSIIPRTETKPIASPAAMNPLASDEPPPGFVEVKPRAARAPTASRVAKVPPATAESKPVAKPKPTPPALRAVEQKPARAPTPKPTFEDWETPEGAATSVGNRVSPAIAAVQKSETSVIVDLEAKPTADKPRRPQSYPVIQTSEQSASASGAVAEPLERSSAPALPPPPAAPEPMSPALGSDRAESPDWSTPLPQRLSEQPIAAATSWPSATAPLAQVPDAPLAGGPHLLRRRGVVIAIAGAVVLAIVFALSGSHEAKHVAVAATPAAKPAAPVGPTPTTQAPAAAIPAPTPVAAVEPVTRSPKSPVKKPVPTHRIMRRKPVVVDYDKKPTSLPADDQTLAQARAEYTIGNQFLFAGANREAVAAYRKALSIYPSYAAGYRGLGLAFTELDDKHSAVAAFKTYVKLAPAAKDVALIKKRIRILSAR